MADPTDSRPPARPVEGVPADDIDEAVARFAALAPRMACDASALAPAPALPEPPASADDHLARAYRVREVAAVLGAFAAAMILLDAEGLVFWARRMEVGPTQDAWLGVLGPFHRGLDAIGLSRPRRWAMAAGDRMARALGAGEPALFAEAWVVPDDGGGDFPPPADDAPPASLPLPPPTEPRGEGADELADLGDGRATVLLVGDSLMGGSLASALARALQATQSFRVARAHENATGLSRPEVFDWLRIAPSIVNRRKPQFVVCALGGNDAQRIRHAGRQLAFGEPAWDEVYRERVKAMMRSLTGRGARLLWLSLPPMRDERLWARATHLNRLVEAASREVDRVDYLEVGMLLSGPDRRFASYRVDATGRLVRVRSDDGVHYTAAGARAVARWVADWLVEKSAEDGPPDAPGRRGEPPSE